MYSGNATVVNFLMRFPEVIPVALAVGIITAAPAPVPAPPPAPAPVVVAAPAPAPAPVVAKPVETLCPPQAKLTKAELAKLTPKERGILKVRGCIKG